MKSYVKTSSSGFRLEYSLYCERVSTVVGYTPFAKIAGWLISLRVLIA